MANTRVASKSLGFTAATLTAAYAACVTCGAELTDVVEKVEPSVVRIDTDLALGSGVVVDPRGWVVTNYHVIEGATTAKATFRNGKVEKIAGYLIAEATRDLAVLQLEKPNQTLAAISIVANLPRKGEKVAAFGNPQGFSFSTSEGIVAAVRTGSELRQMLGLAATKYDPGSTWIQTTAAISGGNSGGPLVNMQGELVGINTWSRIASQNLNFAIAAPDIKFVIGRASGAVSALSSLPRRPTAISTPKKYKLALPSGHVFSFEIFDVEMAGFRRTSKSDDKILVLKHLNGSLYAMAQHVGGVLNGGTVAFYESKDPMTYTSYLQGARHGVLKTWNEEGHPVLFSQYVKGKRHGLACFFESGEPRMIVEYEHDKPKTIQLMAGLAPGKAFSSIEEADENELASELLKKMNAVESQIKTNEIAFKKEVAAEYKAFRRVQGKRMQNNRANR